jgi:hypothetical protein
MQPLQVHKALNAYHKRVQKAHKQPTATNRNLSFCWDDDDEEEEEEDDTELGHLNFGPTEELPDWVTTPDKMAQDIPQMGLSRLAALMKWCLDADHNVVLAPHGGYQLFLGICMLMSVVTSPQPATPTADCLPGVVMLIMVEIL